MLAEATPPQSESRFISVLGHRIRINIRPGDGSRTPFLLLNGVGANLELLQPYVDQLDPAYEVIRFDVPGTGESPAPLLPYRYWGVCYLVARMLDQLGYRKVDVLGVSWGGALAQQFAFQYPYRCRRLILVSTSTGTISVPGDLSVALKMATPKRYLDPEYLLEIAGELYGGMVRENPDHIQDHASNIRSSSLLGYFYQIMASAGWTSVGFLPFLRQPTLIMSGNDDPIIPLVNAELIKALIPNSYLYVFKCGHLGLGTKAYELAQVTDVFLTA